MIARRLAASWTLACDVLVRSARQRVLWVYLALGTLLVVAVLGSMTLLGDEREGFRVLVFGWDVGQRFSGRAEVARPAVVLAFLWLIVVKGGAGFFGVLLGLVATVNAVGSAFAPGRAELVLPRPVSRAEVVLARFMGALAFAAIQVGWVCVLAVALAGVKLGVWIPGFLWVAPALLLKFSVLLALCTLGVVWSGTRTLGLSAAALVWVVSYVINLAALAPQAGLEGVVAWAQRLLPQVTHQTELAGAACEQGIDIPGFDPWVVVLQAVVWTVLPLVLTVLIVERRDH